MPEPVEVEPEPVGMMIGERADRRGAVLGEGRLHDGRRRTPSARVVRGRLPRYMPSAATTSVDEYPRSDRPAVDGLRPLRVATRSRLGTASSDVPAPEEPVYPDPVP